MKQQHGYWPSSWQTFWRSLSFSFEHARLVMFFLLIYLLAYFLLFVLYNQVNGLAINSLLHTAINSIFSFGMFLNTIFFISGIASLLYLDRGLPLGAIVRSRLLPKLPAIIAFSLVFSVCITVGTLLFIVPGILLFVWWGMGLYVLIYENVSVMQAFRRSAQLVKGMWWPTFGRLIFFFFLFFVLIMLLVTPQVGTIFLAIVALLLQPAFILYFAFTYDQLVSINAKRLQSTMQVSLMKKVGYSILAVVVFSMLTLAISLASFLNGTFS